MSMACSRAKAPGIRGESTYHLTFVKGSFEGSFVARTLNALFHRRSIWWPSRYSAVSAACGRDWTHAIVIFFSSSAKGLATSKSNRALA